MSEIITKESNGEFYETLDGCVYCQSCGHGEGLEHRKGCAVPYADKLEPALREAREVLALALRGFENRIGHSTQESEEIKVAVNSIDALLGKK